MADQNFLLLWPLFPANCEKYILTFLRLIATHLFHCLLNVSHDSLGLVLLCRFVNFDLCMIALLSSVFTNSAWVPRILSLDFISACLQQHFRAMSVAG